MALMARDGVDADGNPVAQRIRIAHQLLVYPVLFPSEPTKSDREHARAPILASGLRHFFVSSYLGKHAEKLKQDWRVSPFRAHNHSRLPPATLIHAEFDPLRDEGAMYAQMLRDAQVDVVELDYGQVPHGFYAFLSLKVDTTLRSVTESVAAVNRALVKADQSK